MVEARGRNATVQVRHGRIYAPPPPPRRRTLLPLRRSNRRRPADGVLRWRRVGQFLLRALPRALRLLLEVVGVGLLTCGALYGWDALVHSPRLAVQRVQIVGLEGSPERDGLMVRQAEVQALAAVELGSPLLLLDTQAICQRVGRHPWVRHVRVRRRPPDTVSIEVAPQVPSVVVSLAELYVANEDGQLFKTFTPRDQLSLPVITGLPANATGETASAQVAQVLPLIAAVADHPMEMGSLDELHWDEALGWSVVVRSVANRQGLLTVHLGRAPLDRLPMALSTLRYLIEKGQAPQVIWADGTKNPQRVQVTLQQGRA